MAADTQIQPRFPSVKRRQLCHYHEQGGYVKAVVSCVFDGGFEITKKDGTIVRFLESRWDATDAASVFWLTRRGRPIRLWPFGRL